MIMYVLHCLYVTFKKKVQGGISINKALQMRQKSNMKIVSVDQSLKISWFNLTSTLRCN